jgi:2-oxoisovalerate dehydrogenase E2 component (dihydrolipoyl transacylase)
MRIELPQVGESVTEGMIARWLKGPGDRVEKYDPLVEVVTDKVTMEMPSPDTGVLTRILVAEGETVPMGAVIAEMDVEGEAAGPEPALTPAADAEIGVIGTTGVLLHDVAPVGPTGSGGAVAPAPAERTTVRASAVRPSDAPLPAARDSRKRYSPAVQRLAAAHDVDLSLVTGTGMGGRVTRKDLQAHIDLSAAAPASPSVATGSEAERIPTTPVRRMIADNMVKSATQIPQAWSIVEVDVTSLVRRRTSARDEFQRTEGINLTYLPFAIKAVAESLKGNPLLNSSWDGDAVLVKKRINIGVAVAAKGGLVVPVIHDADLMSIAGLAKAIDGLSDRARRGKLELADVQGGTFTVNNTGALGSVVSQPLVNYPQAAIITTEAIVKRPVIVDDAIAIRSMMNVCLTFDHRILDGSEAGAFINDVKRLLEGVGPDTPIY